MYHQYQDRQKLASAFNLLECFSQNINNSSAVQNCLNLCFNSMFDKVMGRSEDGLGLSLRNVKASPQNSSTVAPLNQFKHRIKLLLLALKCSKTHIRAYAMPLFFA